MYKTDGLLGVLQNSVFFTFVLVLIINYRTIWRDYESQ